MGNRRPKEIMNTLREQEASEMLLPYFPATAVLMGSTDVGDVSWVTPTAQVVVACQAFGTPGHSWQTVSQGVAGVAHRGMLTAAKVLARTAAAAILRPELMREARQEHRESFGGQGYVCPIPPGVRPKPLG